MKEFNVRVLAPTLGTVAGILYIICVLGYLLWPTWPMYSLSLWQAMFLGFSWTIGGVLIGLIETVVYGLGVGVIFVLVYNWFARHIVATAS